jgi:hypothetical protein
MRYLWIFWALMGIWLLASAATERGLTPSGHGAGRVSEVILGVLALVYAAYRARKFFSAR